MFQALTILVVEDYLPLQTSLIEVLRKFGHHVQGIESAEAFDEEAQDHDVDLAIIDVNLPGEDGFSLARRLHAVQPSLGIIILTAKTDEIDKVTGYECGADIYLTKPVGFDELMAAVNALSRRLGKSAPTAGGGVTRSQRPSRSIWPTPASWAAQAKQNSPPLNSSSCWHWPEPTANPLSCGKSTTF